MRRGPGAVPRPTDRERRQLADGLRDLQKTRFNNLGYAADYFQYDYLGK